ncbi:hypothetical protein CIB84_012628 [Bambusicola thoracicus]|uniref:Uncharacterized protein n=1 Tax=Bambusicola thoracicus TaxID=9083 RepID=A0A2P4SHM7_BAMTH|nr:hypothetical protein CIB84_012628 [Bambusicola thoracicus]
MATSACCAFRTCEYPGLLQA